MTCVAYFTVQSWKYNIFTHGILWFTVRSIYLDCNRLLKYIKQAGMKGKEVEMLERTTFMDLY